MTLSATARSTESASGSRAAGFSLIELVAVIVIIGALTAVVVPRLNISGFEQFAFRQEVLAGLRYAQKTAVAAGCPVRVRFDSTADEVSLFYENDPDNSDDDCGGTDTFNVAVPDPTGGDFTRSAESGADLTFNGNVTFDRFGANESSSTQNVTFASAATIKVEGVTGYVHD